MSAFDATLNIGSIGLVSVGEPDADGKIVAVQLLLGVKTDIPVGPGQLLPLSLGDLRIPLDKNSVEALIEALQSANEKLKEQPVAIDIASSLSGVEQAAKLERGLRGQ